MALPLTRAQLRDEIRRKCGRKPLIDYPPFDPQTAGEPSQAQPEPTNNEINAVLDLVTRQINAKCRFAANVNVVVQVAAVPSTYLGVYYTPIYNIPTGTPGLGNQAITEIRRLVYQDAVTNPTLLQATAMYQMDARQFNVDAEPPGTPRNYWVQGYQLALWPAPALACTVTMVIGTALAGFLTDNDHVDQLPLTLHDAWLYGALTELGGRNARDQEWAYYQQVNAPVYADYLLQIADWAATDQNPEYSPAFTFNTYRRGAGLRSNRR